MRDPEIHRTKKGNERHFGMKCHIGVDAGSGYVHSMETTAADTHDVTVSSKLIRKDDDVVIEQHLPHAYTPTSIETVFLNSPEEGFSGETRADAHEHRKAFITECLSAELRADTSAEDFHTDAYAEHLSVGDSSVQSA